MQVSPPARAMAMSPTLSLLLLSAEIESPLQRLHRYADADPVEPVECFNACSCLECRWRRVCFIFFSLTRSPVPFKDCSARAESQLRRSYAPCLQDPGVRFSVNTDNFSISSLESNVWLSACTKKLSTYVPTLRLKPGTLPNFCRALLRQRGCGKRLLRPASPLLKKCG